MRNCTFKHLGKPSEEKYLAGRANARAGLRLIRHAGPVFGYVIELAGYGVAFVSLALLLASGLALFYGIDRPKRSSRR